MAPMEWSTQTQSVFENNSWRYAGRLRNTPGMGVGEGIRVAVGVMVGAWVGIGVEVEVSVGIWIEVGSLRFPSLQDETNMQISKLLTMTRIPFFSFMVASLSIILIRCVLRLYW